MQGSSIRIGSIDLQDFEVPASLRFGGAYKLAVHRSASGHRYIERLGPDDAEIRFQGTFSGPQAELRARRLNNLRLSGQSVWLTWRSFRYSVIVKVFLADYRSAWWIPFQVSCLIVDQPGVTAFDGPVLAALVSADLDRAMLLLAGSDDTLSVAQMALSADNACVAGTAARSQAVAAVQVSLATIDGAISRCSGDLGDANRVFDNDLGSFSNAVACAGTLAATTNARSYMSRIQTYLLDAGA